MFGFLLLLLTLTRPAPEETRLGYHFVNGRATTVIKFHRYKNLIVIPAQLNDTLTLNLILDTGISSLILFSNKCAKLNNLSKGKKVKVAGRGEMEFIECDVSFPNQLKLGDIIGRGIGAAVLKNKELMEAAPGIDGIIGYELFVRFCIQIDYSTNTITLFNEVPETVFENFSSIALNINNLRPEIEVTLQVSKKKKLNVKTLIDTGSSFGLLVYDTKRDKFGFYTEETKIGTGLAGTVVGYRIGVLPFQIGDEGYTAPDSNLVLTDGNKSGGTTASIGGGFLKNFIVLFDYPHSRFYIKRAKGESSIQVSAK
jgi:hypothetical protein